VRLGRPRVGADKEKRIREMLCQGVGIARIGRTVGCGTAWCSEYRRRQLDECLRVFVLHGTGCQFDRLALWCVSIRFAPGCFALLQRLSTEIGLAGDYALIDSASILAQWRHNLRGPVRGVARQCAGPM
jgi:hypothetical protein